MMIGTLLALAALAVVLYPLFRDPLNLGRATPKPVRTVRPNTAVDALREIEFDHVTGKLSDRDYAELKATYTERAVAGLRADQSGALICPVCGPRPEPDAAFCSECGRQLAA